MLDLTKITNIKFFEIGSDDDDLTIEHFKDLAPSQFPIIIKQLSDLDNDGHDTEILDDSYYQFAYDLGFKVFLHSDNEIVYLIK